MDERVQKILDHPQRVPVIVGVLAFGSGLGLGYILGKRNKYSAFVELETEEYDDPNQMKLEFDSDQFAEDLSEIRRHMESNRNSEMVLTYIDPRAEDEPEEEKDGVEPVDKPVIDEVDPAVEEFVAKKLKEAMEEKQIFIEPGDEVVTSNVFAESDSDWDYDSEVKQRSSSEPYVLHRDEFYEDELEYTQITLTYYEGDDVMVDEEDVPIYNYKQVTGSLKFGHGSGDPNVVHVRNDKRRCEYEILRHEGLYSVEVLGLEIENNQRRQDLRHSSDKKFKLE